MAEGIRGPPSNKPRCQGTALKDGQDKILHSLSLDLEGRRQLAAFPKLQGLAQPKMLRAVRIRADNAGGLEVSGTIAAGFSALKSQCSQSENYGKI